MTRRPLALLLTLLATTLLIACGSDDDTSEATTPTEAAASTSEATASGGGTSGGDASAPDLGDFDVPLPEWADAVAVDDSGPLTVVQFIVPLDRQADTVAFYEEWATGQPEDYLRTDSEGGGVSLQADVAAGETKTIVSVLSPLQGDDFVTVTVSRGVFE